MKHLILGCGAGAATAAWTLSEGASPLAALAIYSGVGTAIVLFNLALRLHAETAACDGAVRPVAARPLR